MLVRTAMLPNPLTVSPKATLVEFIRDVLNSNQTTGVVLEGDRLAGIVSVYDIFRKILPAHVDHKLANVIREGYFDERFEKFRNTTVGEIMTRRVDCLGPDDAVIQAVAMFVRQKHKTIPVVENGRYIGSITRRSVLWRVTEPKV